MLVACRSPEEMRMKLSVQFQGEEGIDAGGVSREWYQVRSDECLRCLTEGGLLPCDLNKQRNKRLHCLCPKSLSDTPSVHCASMLLPEESQQLLLAFWLPYS